MTINHRLITGILLAIFSLTPISCETPAEPEQKPDPEVVDPGDTEDPENPDEPDTPDDPDTPDTPDEPDTPEEPDEPEEDPNTFTLVSASTWKAGDKIIVQDHESVIEVTITADSISEDGKTATVKIEGLNPNGGYDEHYHAMYPAENWGSVSHGLYYYLYFRTSNAPCAIAFDKNKEFKFTGLCSSITFTATGDYDGYRFEGGFDEVVEYLSFYVKHKYADGGKYEVRDLGGDITSIEGTLDPAGNTVHILNNTQFKKGFRIILTKNGTGVSVAEFSQNRTLSNCQNIDLGDITSSLVPYEEPEDDPDKDPYHPVMGDYTKMDVNVVEISGLCLTEDKTALWAVGDQGVLSKVDFNGKATKVWTHDADMEGVTLVPETGNLLIAVEGSQKVYEVYAPDFNTYSTIFYIQDAIDGGFGNSGLEGISYYKDGMVFVGAQSGATLWLVNMADGSIVWKKRLDQVTSKIDEVGGLFYDPVTDHLWVTDSEMAKLFVFNADCTKLIANYSVSFIDNAESVCVDHDRNCVWVGSDQDSPKLFKINFTDL